MTLHTIPQVIDGLWWRQHAHLVQCQSDGSLSFRDGEPREVVEAKLGVPSAPDLGAFDGVVGQALRIERLEDTVQGSALRDRAFPHTLFYGPPGTGKSSLARALAQRMGARLHAATGPLLRTSGTMLRLLAALQEGDVLFIDEVHAMPRATAEVLYQALEERRLTLTLSSGARVRTVEFQVPRFTLIAATTNDDDVAPALWSRFGLTEFVDFYSDADLAAVAMAAAQREGRTLDEAAALRLASRSRGAPRTALRLLDRVLDMPGDMDVGAVDRVLAKLGYDVNGLQQIERNYLRVLHESRRPVSLTRLSRLLGMRARSVVERIEPHLFQQGLVRMTAQGRVASKGYPTA